MSVVLTDQLLSNAQCQQESLLVFCLEQRGDYSLDWTCTEGHFMASGGEGGREGGGEGGREGGGCYVDDKRRNMTPPVCPL